MLIQISASGSGKRPKSRAYSSEDALKLATLAIAKLNHIEETSAGLLALKFMAEVESGTDKVMKNSGNGNSLSFRRI